MSHKAKMSLSVGFALVAITALAAVAASPASAADEHLYDPTLSLTGSTAVSSEDPIPDPGSSHPSKGFEKPCGTATDPHGDIYVTTPKLNVGSPAGGRIDVFNPEGEFLVEFEHEFAEDRCALAVDSEGNVYSGGLEGSRLDLYEPSSYPPSPSTTYSLGKTFELSKSGCGGGLAGTAIDPSNDHLYVGYKCTSSSENLPQSIEEFGSAAEGSPPVAEFRGSDEISRIDVYGKNHDVYAVAATKRSTPEEPTRLFVVNGATGQVRCEIEGDEVEGAGVPEGGIDVDRFGASIAVDQANGDVYLYDIFHGIVYQFAVRYEGEGCEFDYVGTLPKPPTLTAESPLGEVIVDDPLEAGEAGYDSPNEGHVYVTAGKSASNSHLFAFRPKVSAPPQVEAQEATDIAETEAVLRAELNPNGLDAKYHFEYTTQADYEANNFESLGYINATKAPIPDADAGAGGAFAVVSEPITGLQPDTVYRFRLVASNCEAEGSVPDECQTIGEGKAGEEGEDATFATYPPTPEGLPDGRAYELVTPPDTNGRIPTMGMLGPHFAGIGFGTVLASPGGDSVVFGSNSGALPGLGGGGVADTYEALRDPVNGWQSHFTGLSGAQAERPEPGGISPDHGYAFWAVEVSDGLLANPETHRTTYLRVPPGITPSPNCAVEAEPAGRFEWIGCGSLARDSQAGGAWISEGGGHVIFVTGNTNGQASTPVKLEPCAPPTGVRAIYDRTPGGPTHCISVPPAGASAEVEALFEQKSPVYEGASTDGSAVAFEIAGTLYARLDNAETVEVATGSPAFGGISRDGSWVFYLKDAQLGTTPQGEIFACHVAFGPCAGPAATQAPIQIGSGGKSILVNVSADGSHVYFVSPEQLDGNEGEEGGRNLYVWDGQEVRFIAVLDPLDLNGQGDPYGQGLGFWVTHSLEPSPIYTIGPADNPSRSTPDGSVLVFQSHADLSGSSGAEHWQIFRYDAEAEPGERLLCISCNPTGAPSGSDATLEVTEEGSLISHVPLDSLAVIANVTEDGRRVFFESADRLVPQDLDGKVDVYEWSADGSGDCTRRQGCLALISGGRSAEDDRLYGMTPDGSDIFFFSADTLVPGDPDGTPSVYDARVNGGFPEPPPPPGDCLGEACQPAVAAPDEATPATSSHEGPGNPRHVKPSCPKGKRQVRRAGKARCVKRGAKGPHHKRHKRTNPKRRAAR